jgi:hypothetical protein
MSNCGNSAFETVDPGYYEAIYTVSRQTCRLRKHETKLRHLFTRGNVYLMCLLQRRSKRPAQLSCRMLSIYLDNAIIFVLSPSNHPGPVTPDVSGERQKPGAACLLACPGLIGLADA